MVASDRDQIVILTSGFSGYTLTETTGATPYVPVPVDASRVFLSALGGWLTSRGAWPYPVSYLFRDIRAPAAGPGLPAEPGPAAARGDVVPLDLIEWDHLATQGRDHYVKIVYEGYPLPVRAPGHAGEGDRTEGAGPERGRREPGRFPGGLPAPADVHRAARARQELSGRAVPASGPGDAVRHAGAHHHPGHAGHRSAAGQRHLVLDQRRREPLPVPRHRHRTWPGSSSTSWPR